METSREGCEQKREGYMVEGRAAGGMVSFSCLHYFSLSCACLFSVGFLSRG